MAGGGATWVHEGGGGWGAGACLGCGSGVGGNAFGQMKWVLQGGVNRGVIQAGHAHRPGGGHWYMGVGGRRHAQADGGNT